MLALSANSGFACPYCGSARIRRSAVRGFSERLVQTLSPYRPFRCHDCNHRGWHLGRPRARRHSSSTASRTPAGRRVEKRDIQARTAKRNRTLLMLIVASALGAASGGFLHGCQDWMEVGGSVAAHP